MNKTRLILKKNNNNTKMNKQNVQNCIQYTQKSPFDNIMFVPVFFPVCYEMRI